MVGLLLVLCLVGTYHSAEGGCAGKCCPGSDVTCFTTDWRMDRVYGTCYCDERCVQTHDCCFDYPTECPAQPCVVSEWSHWSGCAEPCRPSFRVRRRRIESQPRNSGPRCPKLEEQAGCMEYRDHQGRLCAQTEGAAFITTMAYNKGRTPVFGAQLDSGFCMEFKMESLTPQCTVENRPQARWMQYLREGFTVCVSCQPPAMNNHSRSCQGDGTLAESEQLLHWEALGSHRCRGTWRKEQRVSRCTCPEVHSFIFI